MFDWLNCQSCSGMGSKGPLTKERLPALREILAKCTDLLPMCGIHGNTVVNTRRYVDIMGLLCAGNSLVAIAEELLNLPGFLFFLAYRLSQDALELFFNGIRRAGGWNNNPTALQFSFTMRRFLAHAVVVVSPFGNVTNVENSRPFVLELIGPSVSLWGAHDCTGYRELDSLSGLGRATSRVATSLTIVNFLSTSDNLHWRLPTPQHQRGNQV